MGVQDVSKRRAHYCVRIANEICEQIALGNSLRQALEKVGPLGPSMATLWRWLDEFPEFRIKYDRARQMQGDMLADEMLEMAQEVIKRPALASAIRVAADILQWQAGIRDSKYNSKTVRQETKAIIPPDELRKEIKRLEQEIGVGSTTPAMNTAPNYAKQKPMPDIDLLAASPAPAPNCDSDESEL